MNISAKPNVLVALSFTSKKRVIQALIKKFLLKYKFFSFIQILLLLPSLGYAQSSRAHINITHANEDFKTMGGLDVVDGTNPVNSLYTQVSGKPFGVTCVLLNSDKQTPIKMEGNIILELIEPSSNTVLKDLTGQITYSSNNGTMFLNINNISYPSAVKKVAFRVRYYYFGITNEQYDYGIPKSKTPKVLQNDHPACSSECASKVDWSCYKCIAENDGITDYSRDSFSIRPAKFSINLKSNAPYIGGRNYKIDINASNFQDTVDKGYIETIDQSVDKNVSTKLITPLGCSISSYSKVMSHNIKFISGEAKQQQYSYNNIGTVNIIATDNNWSLVDIDKNNNGTVYSDCIKDSNSSTPDKNGKVGCMIKGSETVTFIPLTFRNTLTIQDSHANTFTYLANQNSSQAAKLIFTYAAIIDDNTSATIDDNAIATNYVGNCFAEDINTTIAFMKKQALNWGDTQTRVWMYDTNTTLYVGESNASFTNSKLLFLPSTPGEAKHEVLINFDRNVSIPDNPFQIFKNDLNVSLIEYNTTYPVSGNDFNRTLNDSNATFVYARSHATRQRFVGKDGDIPIYYEVFCSGATCDKSLLPSGFASKTTDDPRWFINAKHTSDFGILGTVTQKFGSSVKEVKASTGNHPDKVKIHYNEKGGYPYKTTMENNASLWLIYNPFNVNATKNEFEVELIGKTKQKAGSFTDLNNASNITNRRTMW